MWKFFRLVVLVAVVLGASAGCHPHYGYYGARAYYPVHRRYRPYGYAYYGPSYYGPSYPAYYQRRRVYVQPYAYPQPAPYVVRPAPYVYARPAPYVQPRVYVRPAPYVAPRVYARPPVVRPMFPGRR